MYTEIEGDLIALALEGKFDVIAHGCNCFNTMGAGIALPMAEVFCCNNQFLEGASHKGDIDKLGRITVGSFHLKPGEEMKVYSSGKYNNRLVSEGYTYHNTVNAYTQFFPGADLSYPALSLCLTKINHQFKGKHVGLPQIGCGIAGGDWDRVKQMIQKRMPDCDVTVVIYKPKINNDVLKHETTEAS